MSTRAGATLESEAGRFGTSAEEAVTAPVFRKVVPGVCCARSSNWHERHSGDANCTSEYPGDAAMQAWRSHTDYDWVGYYLGSLTARRALPASSIRRPRA